MVAVAIVGAAAVGGVAAVASGNKAAKVSKENNAANNALITQQGAENKATLAPFVAAGAPATSSIQALLGLGGDKAATDKAFEQYRGSTGYDFRLSEGNKGLTAALGKNSMLDSGAAVKSAIKFNQRFAESDGFRPFMSDLQQQQGVGLTAASAQVGVGQNMVNNITTNNNNAAAAQASAALNTGNAINGALQSGVSAYALNQGLKSSYALGAGTYP